LAVKLPTGFRKKIVGAFGEAGSRWLPEIPRLLERYASEWDLVLASPQFDLSYNYVVPATTGDGATVVLKLGVPHDEIHTEIEALRLFNGRGAARLLRSDADGGALLIERLVPGRMLREEEDDHRATETAAILMKRLLRPAPQSHRLFTVAGWASGFERMRNQFDGGTGPLPTPLVARAEAIYEELLGEGRPAVVLHGDLHHENILFSQNRGWLAIDPKGVAGEAEYETGALLRNPPGLAAWPDLDRVLACRLSQVSEILGYDRKRLALWSVAQAVLSAWWSVEDSGDSWCEAMIHLAGRFLAQV
jgi:streptomycin 6-kinase